MIYAKVLDKKTGGERLVTKKAYEVLAGRRYELIEYLDDVTNQRSVAQATTEQKKSAEPAGNMTVKEIVDQSGLQDEPVQEVVKKRGRPAKKDA
jgi:hypothetical protein